MIYQPPKLIGTTLDAFENNSLLVWDFNNRNAPFVG